MIVLGNDGRDKIYSFPKFEYLQIFDNKVKSMRAEVKASKNLLAGFPKN